MSSTLVLRHDVSCVDLARGLARVSLLGERLLSYGRTLVLADESLTGRGGLFGGTDLLGQLAELLGDTNQDRGDRGRRIAIFFLRVFLLRILLFFLRVFFIFVVL